MHRVFQTFIDLLADADSAEAFSHTMAVTASALDLSCFAYLALPNKFDRKARIISTYPSEWVTRYVQSHYERIDPVIVQALQSPEPFQWGIGSSAASQSTAQRQLFDEASEFGIRSGFTVPIHDGRGPIAALTFAADQHKEPFETCVNAHARVLQLMALYFHAHLRRKLANNYVVKGIALSPREFECLEWASQGKSAWEIAHILGISRHTVSSYLETAKEKLGVRTIVQAATRLAAAKREEHN